MIKAAIITAAILVLLTAGGCGGSSTNTSSNNDIQMSINNVSVSVEWENNPSVEALKALAPLTVNMSMYGGFEQVGNLGHTLPRNDVRTTTSAGDIVLYSGNQIVIFYGSNTWAYTRLGKITDKTTQELKELLGTSDAVLTLSR